MTPKTDAEKAAAYDVLAEMVRSLLACSNGYYSAIEIDVYEPGHVDGDKWWDAAAEAIGYQRAD
jgi:hypothetical protein